MTVKVSKAGKSNDSLGRDKAVLTKSSRHSAAINASELTGSEFEQVAEASNDAIRIINKDFTIRYINQAFAEMTGVSQNYVIGKKCWKVFRVLFVTHTIAVHSIYSAVKIK
jgi:PAS domain-containing protein